MERGVMEKGVKETEKRKMIYEQPLRPKLRPESMNLK